MLEINYRIRHWLERCQIKIAYLMPRWLVRWCAIRLIAHGTTGQWGNQIVSELSAMDALDRWEIPREG